MNIRDIAKIAGVSTATVSRVLNNPEAVRPEKRNQILEIIQEYNYIPNAMARSLSTNSSLNIGVALPDIQNYFFSSILRGITNACNNLGYNVYFYDTEEDIQKEYVFLKTVKEQRFQAIIMTPVCETNTTSSTMITNLEEEGIPVIIVDRDLHEVSIDGVFFADVDGGYKATQGLINAGHQKIAIIAGDQTMRPGRERKQGYINALNDYDIFIENDYIMDGLFTREGGYHAIQRLMQLPMPPTAIFSSNNLMTLGCVKYFAEHNLTMGKDISLIGYDDISDLIYIGYNISAVERSSLQMGISAAELMQNRLKESQPSFSSTQEIILDTQLILRGSEKR